MCGVETHLRDDIDTYFLLDANARAAVIRGDVPRASVPAAVAKSADLFNSLRAKGVYTPALTSPTPPRPTFKEGILNHTIDYICTNSTATNHLVGYDLEHDIVDLNAFLDHDPVVGKVEYRTDSAPSNKMFNC